MHSSHVVGIWAVVELFMPLSSTLPSGCQYWSPKPPARVSNQVPAPADDHAVILGPWWHVHTSWIRKKTYILFQVQKENVFVYHKVCRVYIYIYIYIYIHTYKCNMKMQYWKCWACLWPWSYHRITSAAVSNISGDTGSVRLGCSMNKWNWYWLLGVFVTTIWYGFEIYW